MSCISNCQANREISCPNFCAARYLLTPGELPDCSHLEKASFSLEVTFISSSCGGGFSTVYISVGLYICEAVSCCCRLPVAHSFPIISLFQYCWRHISQLIHSSVERIDFPIPSCHLTWDDLETDWIILCYYLETTILVAVVGLPPWRGREKVCLIAKRGYGKNSLKKFY